MTSKVKKSILLGIVRFMLWSATLTSWGRARLKYYLDMKLKEIEDYYYYKQEIANNLTEKKLLESKYLATKDLQKLLANNKDNKKILTYISYCVISTDSQIPSIARYYRKKTIKLFR